MALSGAKIRNRYINWLWLNVKKPREAMWAWAKRPPKSKLGGRIKRFRSIQKWAANRQAAAKAAKRRRWFKELRYDAKRKADTLEYLKNHPAEQTSGAFQTWMLNGDPGNISDGTKAAIVRGVAHGLFVTDTYGSLSHTRTSNHYPWNSPDGKGHAVDMAGDHSEMVNWQRSEANRGQDLRELIGPENSLTYSGGTRWTMGEGTSLETAHDNHVHRALYG